MRDILNFINGEYVKNASGKTRSEPTAIFVGRPMNSEKGDLS